MTKDSGSCKNISLIEIQFILIFGFEQIVPFSFIHYYPNTSYLHL
jgi:hypothetical protein